MPKVVQQTTKKPLKKKGGIEDRILAVSDMQTKGIKMAIYGGSGSGKTRFACTATKDLLIIGAEDGTSSVRTDEGVFFFPLYDTSDLSEILDHCRTSLQYKTVVLDTGTMLQELLLKEILGLEELPVQKSWGMASQKQYGQRALKCKLFLKEFLDLTDVGINAIVICQESNYNEFVESEIVAPSIGSALSKSVAEWLHPACDYVGQMFRRRKTIKKRVKVGEKVMETEVKTNEIEFCFRTGIHETYATKFRLPRGQVLPEVIIDPTWDKITELINASPN